MVSVEGLSGYRRCVERIEAAWPAFLERRAEHLVQADRFGSAPEKAAEQILSRLFSEVLDWPTAQVNYQLERADIVLTAQGVRWVVVEAKRPGSLSWHRRAIEAALDQACRYADEQRVRVVAISDGQMLYAADRAGGGLRDRLFADISAAEAPLDLWWLSLHGVYRGREDLDGARLRLLPELPRADETAPPRSEGASEGTGAPLLHHKYALPARCFAYVGNAGDTRTWKLPYLDADGGVDTKRLPGAINAVLRSYRGERVAIPEAAIPDVLVRLARAATAAGRFKAVACDDPADCYEFLAVALAQVGCLDEVG